MDYSQYMSPFSWRYGSPEMRYIWSEHNKRLLWRRIWLALASAQADYGIVSEEQLSDIEQHLQQIDIERSLEIESQIHHDLMAELKVFTEQCVIGGGVLHLGATSMDVEDNADALRQRAALKIILTRLSVLLTALVEKIDTWAETPVMAFTHLQPAEPTTLGYRFAIYGQDLLVDWENLSRISQLIKGKGFKGAVGTAASYGDLIGLENLPSFESRISTLLDMKFYTAATQTYPRKQDYELISALASLGLTLYKMAFDIRILQSPPYGEWSEPFGEKQVGSSAMPFKRNPIQSEKMDSLSRSLAGMTQVAWHNAAHSLLERTLDDSANRRTLLPESFLIADEILSTAIKIIRGLRVNEFVINRNFSSYAPFACTERLLMALGKAGANRQEMHELLRMHSLKAWEEVQKGFENPLINNLKQDNQIRQYLDDDQIAGLVSVKEYTGMAPQASREIARRIRAVTSA